jgi:hypothetical protein
MRARAEDWTQIEGRLRAIIQGDMKKVEKTQSKTSTGRLDRSIQTLEIWRMGQKSVEWGTSVPYVLNHMAYRKAVGEKQVSLIGNNLQRKVLDSVVAYIRTGKR